MKSNTTPLYVPPIEIRADDRAFQGDAFNNRATLARRLTDCIDRLPNGGVIAIDAPWGEGKSWFGQHWHNQLKTDGYRTAFINAFERDYVEEPFVMLVSELLTSLGASEKSKLKTSGVAVAKAIAPLAVKSLFNAAVQLATGTTDFSEKVDAQIEKAGDAVAASAEKLLSKQIEDYEKSKVAVEGFRATLKEIASAQDKPIVIFIDELDRCRPEFAVKLIERVKHFFEMPNVIFVLLLNRDQLGKAIQGVYGSTVDSDRYIGKFLHLVVGLPKRKYTGHSDGDAYAFAIKVVEKYGFVIDREIQYWCDSIAICSLQLDLSLRDVERCVALLALNSHKQALPTWMLAWPMALKIARASIFSGVLSEDKVSHQVAHDLISDKTLENSRKTHPVLFYEQMHSAAAANSGVTAEKYPFALEQMKDWGLRHQSSSRTALAVIFSTVDIDIK